MAINRVQEQEVVIRVSDSAGYSREQMAALKRTMKQRIDQDAAGAERLPVRKILESCLTPQGGWLLLRVRCHPDDVEAVTDACRTLVRDVLALARSQ